MTSRSSAPQPRGASGISSTGPAADGLAVSVVRGCVGLLLCTALVAQQPGRPAPTQQSQQQPGIGGAGLLQGPPGQGGQQQQPGDEFGSIWGTVQPHQFDGFPTFPSRLRGYGNYPLPVDPSSPGERGAGVAPRGLPLSPGAILPLLGTAAPAEPRRPDWPDWVHAQQKKPLPFAPDQALLVRLVDRVWWRASGDEPFVPLHFHDKFATLSVGGEVEVRQVGQFELLLHESTRVETRGPTRLGLVALDEQNVRLAFGALTWVRLHVSTRVHEVALPDGSTLQIAEAVAPAAAAANPLAMLLQGSAGGAAPAETPVIRPAWIEILRADEPGTYGGRATITNFGDRDVSFRHAFGEVVLHHGERVSVLLTKPAAPIAGELQPAASSWQHEAGVVTCRAESATEVGWCGARLALPAGGSVRFESLQGDAFAPRAAAKAAATEADG